MDKFIETSAKTGENAQEVLLEAAKLLYKDYLKAKNILRKAGDNDKNNENKLERKKPKNASTGKKCC